MQIPRDSVPYRNQKELDDRLWFPDQGRVAHISLVFREIWDTTSLTVE
jgi:hypothetical protein